MGAEVEQNASPSPPPPRKDPKGQRLMEWLQEKNAEYAPILLPLSLLGVCVSFGLNRPAFGAIFGTMLVGSLTTGRPK